MCDSESRFEEPMVGYGMLVATSQIIPRGFSDLESLEKGVKAALAEDIRVQYELTQQQLCEILHTNPKTFRARKYHGTLDTLQGSLVLALARLHSFGTSVLGRDNFISWLNYPSETLRRKPIELLGSYQGILLIESELSSIADGSFG